MGAYLIICHYHKAEEAFSYFKAISTSLVPFRDAGEEPSDFECSVLHCLKGLERASALGW